MHICLHPQEAQQSLQVKQVVADDVLHLYCFDQLLRAPTVAALHRNAHIIDVPSSGKFAYFWRKTRLVAHVAWKTRRERYGRVSLHLFVFHPGSYYV